MSSENKGKRYSEAQILRILKEVENGRAVSEVCHEYGVAEGTVYRWRAKYAGLERSELQRLRELEAENRRLRGIVAQRAIDIAALKDVVAKKMVSASAQRQVVQHKVEAHQLSQRRACALVTASRSTVRYAPREAADEAPLVAAVRTLAGQHPVYGCRPITALFKRAHWRVNHKRVYRIWRQERLQLPRRKVRKRRVGSSAGQILRVTHKNHVWSYDFLEARPDRGGRLRILAVLDEYTCECLALEVARSIPAQRVIAVLEWLFLVHGTPERLRSDNGPEFIADAGQTWLHDRGCATVYITLAVPRRAHSSRASTASCVPSV
jgi:putative transposase